MTLNGNGSLEMASGDSFTAGEAWTDASSRSYKDRFIELKSKSMLDKIEQMEIEGWYKKKQ